MSSLQFSGYSWGRSRILERVCILLRLIHSELNYLTGKRVHLRRHAQLCLGKRKGLWSRTFSNCISILNSEAYIPIKRGEECTTCDTTRLKWPVYALVSSQETGSVRPARVDLPSYRHFLTANQWPSRTLPVKRHSTGNHWGGCAW